MRIFFSFILLFAIAFGKDHKPTTGTYVQTFSTDEDIELSIQLNSEKETGIIQVFDKAAVEKGKAVYQINHYVYNDVNKTLEFDLDANDNSAPLPSRYDLPSPLLADWTEDEQILIDVCLLEDEDSPYCKPTTIVLGREGHHSVGVTVGSAPLSSTSFSLFSGDPDMEALATDSVVASNAIEAKIPPSLDPVTTSVNGVAKAGDRMRQTVWMLVSCMMVVWARL